MTSQIPSNYQVRNDPTDRDFGKWLSDFGPIARRNGISSRCLDAAFDGVTLDPEVIRKDRHQPENKRSFRQYLDVAVSERRVEDGLVALGLHQKLFTRIASHYRVEPTVVAAIWGLESNFGANLGDFNVIQSLATLACEGRRRALFERQLVGALTILQAGDIATDRMRGSWAGAMGHTQFMPTSYLQFAVDFDGDGRRNIWGVNPDDALASCAAYLSLNGWRQGLPWGNQVKLRDGIDADAIGLGLEQDATAWEHIGVSGVLAPASPASVLLPSGKVGEAYAVYGNFRALLSYNAATAYAFAVGLLSDQLEARSRGLSSIA